MGCKGLLTIRIGNVLKKRMSLMGITLEELADKSFLTKEYIEEILSDSVVLEGINDYDLALICNILGVKEEYFSDEKVRNNDLLTDGDTKKVKEVKVRLQNYMHDFNFLNLIKERKY